jgi:hypothetical protein
MPKRLILLVGLMLGLAGGALVYGTISVLCDFQNCKQSAWILPAFPVFFGVLSGWAIEKLMRK